jgi:prevent-host-death family protein
MNKVSIITAKNQLNGLIDRVKQGETIVIIESGKPVAQLQPVNIAEPILSVIHASGLLKLPVAKLDLAVFLAAPRSTIPSNHSLTSAIIEDRDRERNW